MKVAMVAVMLLVAALFMVGVAQPAEATSLFGDTTINQGGTGIGVGVGVGVGVGGKGGNAQGGDVSIQQGGSSGLPMNTPAAVAPGLTSGGSQVCLGSFAVGISGPGAGVSFGKTVQDKGCAKRQLFILLFNTGDDRAQRVLDSLYEESMGTEEQSVAQKSAAVVANPGVPMARPAEVQGN